MFNQMLGKVSGVDIWLIISLIIFGLFFIGAAFYAIGMKNNYTERMSNLPLGNEINQENKP